jgi:hypothetical protein
VAKRDKEFPSEGQSRLSRVVEGGEADVRTELKTK